MTCYTAEFMWTGVWGVSRGQIGMMWCVILPLHQLASAYMSRRSRHIRIDRCVCVGAAAASFASYVATMSKTGVLVSRHGPMLANALFLPPGKSSIPSVHCGTVNAHVKHLNGNPSTSAHR